MDLSPEQVVAAEFVGVEFLPASADQVHRLSMQRKVFRLDGRPVLATRDGSFFETAATLSALIEEGKKRHRDLAEWEAAAPAVSAEAEEPEALPDAPGGAAASPPTEPQTALEAAAPAAQARGKPDRLRWVTAGAERRGRAAQHWSERRKQ